MSSVIRVALDGLPGMSGVQFDFPPRWEFKVANAWSSLLRLHNALTKLGFTPGLEFKFANASDDSRGIIIIIYHKA